MKRKPPNISASRAKPAYHNGKDEPQQYTKLVAPRSQDREEYSYHTAAPSSLAERKRLFLRVGDEVSHCRYEEWGIGVVVEIMTSSVPGGTCLARIRFQDGQLRCFNNDLDNESCCYYFGVRRYWNPTRAVDTLAARLFAIKR